MRNFSATRRFVLEGASAAALMAAGSCATANASPVVRIRDGRLSGFSRNGALVFLGIPYGASTAGAMRFLPPAPPVRWRDVFNATRLGQRAPQTGQPIYALPGAGSYMAGGRHDELLQLNEPMGEDCLVLNVLTPGTDRARRPVIVYIHGGGFTTGSGATMSVSDRFVAEHDTVVVTVNHRLGALGFAYLGDLSPRYEAGNPGMLDLIAALEWVRDNIHAFGGDPEKVTISGESGGGAKVALLMAMPQATGLFRAAIIESGILPMPAPAADAANAVRNFMSQRGLSNADALQALPAEELLTISASGPVADGHTLTADPWRAAPSTAASLPLMIGHCAHEVTGFMLGRDRSVFDLDWAQLPARLAQGLHRSEAELAPALAAYRAAYPNENASGIFFRMMSIDLFGRSAVELADRKCTQQPPVFFYRFEYDTGLFGLRAFHTAELPLTMRMVLQPAAEPLSQRMAAAWANFARSGDPNADGSRDWPRYDPTQQRIMVFDRDVVPPGPDPEAAARGVLLTVLGPSESPRTGP